MAALMVLDRSLEPKPEPFRMQPDVEIVIDFGEYLKFVQSLPTGHSFLYFTVDELHQAVEAHNELAPIKSFYTDTALAVCKELFFAESYAAGATAIRHGFCDVVDQKGVKYDTETADALKLICDKRGFTLPDRISAPNMKHWAYACTLLQDVRKGPTKWVEKI